jgi:hypothetical protein
MTAIGDGAAHLANLSLPDSATPGPAGHIRGRSTNAWSPSATREIAMTAPTMARSVDRRMRSQL